MKRLIVSVIGGVVVPIAYAFVARGISSYFEDTPVEYLLWLPIGWPQVVYFYLLPPGPGRPFQINEIALISIQVLLVVIVYSFLIYFLLSWRASRRGARTDEPPAPPDLESVNFAHKPPSPG